MKTSRSTDESLRCSVCHKSQDAVAKRISSPSDYPRAYICDECVAVCNSILEDDRSGGGDAANPANVAFLNTDTGPGHSGPSGRYDAWRDEARIFAWLLDEIDHGSTVVNSSASDAR